MSRPYAASAAAPVHRVRRTPAARTLAHSTNSRSGARISSSCRTRRRRVAIDGDVGSAPGAIQSITTLASTTAMTHHLLQPALALVDYEFGSRDPGCPPAAHCALSQGRPLGQGQRPPVGAGQSLDVASSDDQSIASLSSHQPTGPDPSPNRLRRTAGKHRGAIHVQLVGCQRLHYPDTTTPSLSHGVVVAPGGIWLMGEPLSLIHI